MSRLAQVAATHPHWCPSGRCRVHLCEDGTREVVHDMTVAVVGDHEIWLISMEEVDQHGSVLRRHERCGVDGSHSAAPLRAGEARQVAAALLRAAELLDDPRRVTSSRTS